MADNILHYGTLAIMGPALILQILSSFGIAASVNYMWWTLVVCYGTMVVHGASFVFNLMAYDRDWKDSMGGANMY